MASDNSDRGPVSRGSVTAQPLFAVGAVLLGSFLANFDSRLTSVGLADLRGAFSLGFDEGSWLSTASIGSQIFIAPAVSWLATTFGLRRVLGIPSLVYALVSLILPLVRDYPTLIALGIVHGMLLGTFVPATLMIILRNLPMRWWLPAIAIYAIRIGFAFDTSTSLVGFYVGHLGWQWLYWQGAMIAPLMGLMVWLGTPSEPINRELMGNADWGGMLLLGASMSMIYAGLDQGNRLDWLGSGAVTALLGCGGALFAGFLLNEALVRQPWAHVSVLFSRNIGLAQLVILFYTLTSISNSSLVPNFLGTIALMRPEQSGVLLLIFNPVGTATNAAIQRYMNTKKVPQLFVGGGATRWNNPGEFPWTMGFQPNYQSEGRVFAKYVLKEKPDAKIAVLFQNDDLGKDYLKGLRDGLGA